MNLSRHIIGGAVEPGQQRDGFAGSDNLVGFDGAVCIAGQKAQVGQFIEIGRGPVVLQIGKFRCKHRCGQG